MQLSIKHKFYYMKQIQTKELRLTVIKKHLCNFDREYDPIIIFFVLLRVIFQIWKAQFFLRQPVCVV